MWQLIAIVLSAAMLFYLAAFYISVVAWLNAVGHLIKGNFIRAAAWFSIGSGMLFWWMDADIDFETWLRGSAVIVGMGALGTFVRWHREQQAMQAVPEWPMPAEATGNIVPIIEVDYKRLPN
jgi:hypothetical protein